LALHLVNVVVTLAWGSDMAHIQVDLAAHD
jgi:hypothetical protein